MKFVGFKRKSRVRRSWDWEFGFELKLVRRDRKFWEGSIKGYSREFSFIFGKTDTGSVVRKSRGLNMENLGFFLVFSAAVIGGR